MNQDLADCTASDRKTSAEACTRVMNSGRLPREQVYIGHYNRGWSYFNANAYDKALADFDKSISHNPGYADTYYSRAVVQHERGARDQSLADLDTYLEKKGEIAEAHLNRARVFRARNELDRAFSELQTAGQLDVTDHKVVILRALVLSDMGEQGPARREAETAIEANPDEAGGYYARALVAYREKQFDAATADVDKALSFKDANPIAHTLKGQILEQRGDTSAALASFRRALDIIPKSLDARAAQDEARARVTALGGTEPVPDKVAASETPPAAKPAAAPLSATPPAAERAGCRRFIPSVGTTVAVDCPD
jgi:Tfp pilus assembly protein PilF